MAHPKAFTTDEDAFLTLHWETQWPDWIADRLPGRAAQAVRQRAERLGLPKNPPGRPPVVRQAPETEWTPGRIGALTRLWQEGHTARAIAEKLGGVTHNAVVGKAHRLGLSEQKPRPAPIAAIPTGPAPKACQWPIGDPGDTNFRFCGAPVATDKPHRPYCAAHCAAAYREKPTRQERAADQIAKKLLAGKAA